MRFRLFLHTHILQSSNRSRQLVLMYHSIHIVHTLGTYVASSVLGTYVASQSLKTSGKPIVQISTSFVSSEQEKGSVSGMGIVSNKLSSQLSFHLIKLKTSLPKKQQWSHLIFEAFSNFADSQWRCSTTFDKT